MEVQRDVFVSYATPDKEAADSICHFLEAEGIRCWIAHRNIPPGGNWAEYIPPAIEASRLMVLVFSDSADDSPHVLNEVAIAIDMKRPLIPVRVKNEVPKGGLGFHLFSLQWLNAFTPPLESHAPGLVKRVREILGDAPHGGEGRNPDVLRQQHALLKIPQVASWYRRGMRDAEIGRAAEVTNRYGIVEIVAAPLMGKSELIREIIGRLITQGAIVEWLQVSLSGARSVGEICALLSEHGAFPKSQDSVPALNQAPLVYWIQQYDPASVPALRELVQSVAGEFAQNAPQRRALWVIESILPLKVGDELEIELEPLADGQIFQIIKEAPKGSVHNDPNTIISFAKGNPGLALWAYRSDPSEATIAFPKDAYEWLCQKLWPGTTHLFPAVCFLASRSPLGLTWRLLEQWATRIMANLPPAEVRARLESLLETLEDCQRISVIRFQRGAFDGCLDDLFPEGAGLTVINFEDGNLIDYVLKRTDPVLVEAWSRHMSDFLCDAMESEYDLAAVTWSLHAGDLMPFFRSTFRFTQPHRTWVLAWCEKMQAQWLAQKPNPTRNYLNRALVLLQRIADNPQIPVDVVKELGVPNPAEPDQRYAYSSVVDAHMTGYLMPNGDVDFARWHRTISTLAEANLRVESSVYLSQSLLKRERIEEAWELLDDLVRAWDLLDTTGRALTSYHTLAFLNRNKKVVEAVPDLSKRARGLITDLARELLQIGVAVENISSVANSLFYYVRSNEYDEGQMSPHSVRRYAAALQAVERVAPTRRLQAVLTLGSVYRHYCRQETIKWDEFEAHASDAIESYIRVYTSASLRGLVTYELNALSYIAELCLKATRFCGDDGARRFSAATGRIMIPLVEETRGRLEATLSGSLNRSIWRNIQRDSAMVHCIVALSEGAKAEHVEQARKAFERAMNCLLEEGRTLNGAEKASSFKPLLTNTARLLDFAGHFPEESAVLKGPMVRFLRVIAEVTKGNRNPKLESKRRRILDALG